MITGVPRDYIAAAEALADHILLLIPTHPEILHMNSATELFRIKEFKGGSGLTLFQAGWALANAKQRYHDTTRH